MTRPLNHDAASEALAAAALDALEAEEQAAVLAHAATCPICGPELVALRDAVANLAAAAPMPGSATEVDTRLARARARLLARVTADRADRLLGATGPGEGEAARPLAIAHARGRPSLTPWVTLALAASLVGIAILARSRTTLERQLAAARDSVGTLASTRAQLAERDSLVRRLTGPETVVVSLAANRGPAASALMFWDRSANSWTLYARALPAPAPGKTYQVWLVTATAKISAGTFTPSPAGDAVVHATYPLERNSLRAVAVTEEPAGGVPQPTGQLVMAGEAK
jgi:hypothetical protein